MIPRIGKAIIAAYLNSLVWFTAGSVLSGCMAFVILSTIYHAGVCR